METFSNAVKKRCHVPRRNVIAILCCIGAFSIAACRQIAMGHLIYQPYSMVRNHSQCKEWNISSTFPPGRNDSQEDLVGFRLSYGIAGTLSPIVVGYLSDQFGAKHLFSFCVVVSAIGSMITCLISSLSFSGSVRILQVAVFFFAIGFAAQESCFISLLGHWVPLDQRTFLTAIAFGGKRLGHGSPYMVERAFAWLSTEHDIPFYFTMVVSLSWCVLWQFFGFSSPVTHPSLRIEEREYLRKELEGHVVFGRKKVPVKAMMKSGPFWTSLMARAAFMFNYHLKVQLIPLFLTRVLHYDLAAGERFNFESSLAAVSLMLSFGRMTDYCIKKDYVALLTFRKIYTILGIMGTGIFSVFATFVDCDRDLAVVFLTGADALSAFGYLGVHLAPFDLAPNYGGLVTGIVSLFGILPALLFYMFTVDSLINTHFSEFKLFYTMSLGFLTICAMVYAVWGTADEQPWNKPPVSTKISNLQTE